MKKSILRLSKTTLPVRCTLAFVDICREQSKVYPALKGSKRSAARFLKEAAIEKLISLGIKQKYIKSIT